MANQYSRARLAPTLEKPYTYLNARWSQSTLSNLNFVDECKYYVYGAGGDADSLKGISADFLIRDEVGEFSKDALSISDVSLSASKHPTCLDVGTPFGLNALKRIWQQSDKRKFFYCCVACDEYFQPTMELLCGICDVKCPNCDKEQNKMDAARDGKWVAMRNPKKALRIGFHFTQLINPLVETVQMTHWRDELSPERFKAEILGEI